MSGTPHEQAHRLLSLLFPSEVAESRYRDFGDLVAAARARLSAELVSRQATATLSWRSIHARWLILSMDSSPLE
jgi:hypothetical protein